MLIVVTCIASLGPTGLLLSFLPLYTNSEPKYLTQKLIKESESHIFLPTLTPAQTLILTPTPVQSSRLLDSDSTPLNVTVQITIVSGSI